MTDTLKNLVNAFYLLGARNHHHYENLDRTRHFIESFSRQFMPKTSFQEFEIRQTKYYNVIAEWPGRSDEVLIIGTHYETHRNSRGANRNGTGLAVLLRLIQDLSCLSTERTIRFVFFPSEETGSEVYASSCANKKRPPTGVICLKDLGTSLEDDFLWIVGNRPSEKFLRSVSRSLGRTIDVIPEVTPFFFRKSLRGDQLSFWKHGLPSVLVTGEYHPRDDNPSNLNYEWLATVYRAIRETVVALAGARDVPASETTELFIKEIAHDAPLL